MTNDNSLIKTIHLCSTIIHPYGGNQKCEITNKKATP